MVDNTATKCPHCKTPLEIDEEEQWKRWKKCPSCGADLPLSEVVKCEYCQAIVNSGEHDWVLTIKAGCVTLSVIVVGKAEG